MSAQTTPRSSASSDLGFGQMGDIDGDGDITDAYLGAEVGAEGSPDDRDGDGAGDDVLRTPVLDPAFPGRDGPGAPRRQAGSSDDGAHAPMSAGYLYTTVLYSSYLRDAAPYCRGAAPARHRTVAAPRRRPRAMRRCRRATVLVHYCSYCTRTGSS